MRWLRSTWQLRSLVILLMTSLVPVTLFVPGQSTAQSNASSAHAEWLRAQVAVAPEGDVEAALNEALDVAQATASAQSLQGFLQAFAEAYQAQEPAQSLAELFGTPDRTDDGFVEYLQRQFSEGLDVAPLPRFSTLALVKSVTAVGPDRDTTVGYATKPVEAVQSMAHAVADGWIAGTIVVDEVRMFFTAYPRGP